MELPPPRSGDWSSANRHLTAGGTVEGIPWGNPYREYYLHLTNHIMTFDLLSIELHRYAQSWISILAVSFGRSLSTRNLFYIEWDYEERKIAHFELLWLFTWHA